MRVIAGEFRSRQIKSLPGSELRPTPDRLRETLFNILTPRIRGSIFVDAYAGTGAVGIEALSRGAARAIFLEKSKAAVSLIRENLDTLGILPQATVISGPALRELGKERADIVFIDPPYPLESEYPQALALAARSTPSVIVAQHSARFNPGDRVGDLVRYRTVKQSDNALSFYRPA